ncbi:SHOCT domain-containing protein [Thermospira aquatica]|uniref:SHOCT domain-containing protein n=1 Tax=Thermospira aquatica TaxID=2828656 RepID=A0AAX3BIW3_9SPIR|nr:SHOCT domain-containing protein [Thermospira aquatica]URA11266.1 SHOCT domain-containing protein [Thermospira aquatica]
MSNNKDINIAKIDDSTLERLGDAVMSLYIPDEATHEYMDNMMGGEGSTSLKNMHITIAANYIAYLKGERISPFMGPGMMFLPFYRGRENIFGGWPMGWMHWNYPWMGFGYYGLGGWFMIILLLIVIGVIVYLILRERRASVFSNKTPLDILKERYAKGEISKEEFDRIKKDL